MRAGARAYLGERLLCAPALPLQELEDVLVVGQRLGSLLHLRVLLFKHACTACTRAHTRAHHFAHDHARKDAQLCPGKRPMSWTATLRCAALRCAALRHSAQPQGPIRHTEGLPPDPSPAPSPLSATLPQSGRPLSRTHAHTPSLLYSFPRRRCRRGDVPPSSMAASVSSSATRYWSRHARANALHTCSHVHTDMQSHTYSHKHLSPKLPAQGVEWDQLNTDATPSGRKGRRAVRRALRRSRCRSAPPHERQQLWRAGVHSKSEVRGRAWS
jgi:hypothetical protein